MHMKDCLKCKQEAPKHLLKDIAEAAARKAAKAVKAVKHVPPQTGKGTEPQDKSAEDPNALLYYPEDSTVSPTVLSSG